MDGQVLLQKVKEDIFVILVIECSDLVVLIAPPIIIALTVNLHFLKNLEIVRQLLIIKLWDLVDQMIV